MTNPRHDPDRLILPRPPANTKKEGDAARIADEEAAAAAFALYSGPGCRRWVMRAVGLWVVGYPMLLGYLIATGELAWVPPAFLVAMLLCPYVYLLYSFIRLRSR